MSGHFGHHNIHENQPGSFVSEDLIFATYPNAGVRVSDIRAPFRPEEVGACVPAAPARTADTRPNLAAVPHSADVHVDARGNVYANEFNASLPIMEFLG